MKKNCILFSFLILALPRGTFAQTSLDTLGSYPLELGEQYTTNIIFPYAIAHADLGSGVVTAKKWNDLGKVLLLKSAKPNIAPTNLSVYLQNGQLYSFHVRYKPDPQVINIRFNSRQSQTTPAPLNSALLVQAEEILHATSFIYKQSRSAHLRLILQKVYIRDQLLWLGFKCENRSPIDFEGNSIHCYILNHRGSTQKKAIQTTELEPFYIHHSSGAPLLLASGEDSIAIAFKPFYVGKGKYLELEWRERDGSRLMRMKIKGKYILRARNWREAYETDRSIETTNKQGTPIQ